MEYKIEYSTIMATAEDIVSREAAQTYTAEGMSLYDDIRMVSRDESTKKRLMSEVLVSIRTLCNRLIKHTSLLTEGDGEEQTSFYFELEMSPRREAGKGESLKTLFRSLVVNLFLSKYFSAKNQADLANKYDAFALSDVQVVAKLLYEKLPPEYPEIHE